MTGGHEHTLLVMAGGTGGHIYPGIAVAEVLRALGWRIVWMGNADRMEGRIIPDKGYETAWIRFGALRGKGVMAKLLLPFNLLRGFWQALGVLRRVKPDVVLGMGGYVSFPGGMMAALTGRPLVLHEQNSVAGLANRVLAGVADRVMTGFPKVLNKAPWVGNPVRADIVALPAPEARFAGREGPLRVLVIGGSLGAKVLNDTVPQALAALNAERPRVVHQAGTAQIEALRESYRMAGVDGDLRPFIDDMAQAYAEADVVICRAGALTVAELAAAGVASILVPLPHAVDDHQTGNARFLADNGGAYLLPQSDLTVERLAGILRGLERTRLLDMARAARALARPDAAEAVARACRALAGDEESSQ
ncbi:undecaprenyldiphospho-muramoylpentapeptide beta-N-acetylglucosaminyltransferase [Nitrogeniibacter mangrovi]|uniref:UDP-N-acetylglucosamine--N-acetylmuramyl-(pentapeptide) pyrophosphoryl-undecaprenol N-acetylglucosamine transferase n=1 Tax=Nitrogeniibacter mangrovi TaxID=2016596 RepID=A0A6C1B0B3_9RHOO|nr:undecaprenyldiphospho-muramoylpentapeptide beta-N-acetylglucosaminyltransferase [Nitrogeniibacter mangrovi]QID17032.1 undecaprenyldiphospho-muramoylpentapeptide beta-N-acetylglucosaminyltransferase [Nitrogeniibacter mangrovi]